MKEKELKGTWKMFRYYVCDLKLIYANILHLCTRIKMLCDHSLGVNPMCIIQGLPYFN